MRLYTSYYKSLMRLGFPIVIGQLGTIVLAFADTLMIGHHTTRELAAAAFVNNLFNLVIIFALGFSYAITPTVGRLFGEEKNGRIGEVVKNGIVANLLLAIILVGVMTGVYFSIDNLHQPKELIPLIKPYFIILLVSLPFICLFNVFKQWADGITDTALSMWVLIGGNILNICGNYVLIYGHFGLPELGLSGAGLSTLFSRIVMAFVMAGVFLLRSKYKVFFQGFRSGCINRVDFFHLNKLGWPIACQMGMETASFSLTSIIVGWVGTTALAAHQVMLTISQLGFMIYYGIGAAAAVRISNAYGRQDERAVKGNAYAAIQLVLFLAVVVSIPIFLFRHELGALFTDNRQVQDLVALTVIPFMVYQFGDGMQIVFGNSLRGISYVKPLVFSAFFAFFVIGLPLSYIFAIVLHAGLIGVWWSFPFGLTTAGLLYCWNFRRRVGKVFGKH
ncbi:MATE family efflux transporter [Prevotella sp. AGR2160]|uniref:MATE family efflux transporter n=1 Tax=Prevotella sp. AGR2160 TaxID=1280674 RepID=UPI0004903996|nr:MATE family efflux transporter [Prevotella sp. AGR2160]